MLQQTADQAGNSAAPAGAPVARALAQGEGWSLGEFTCRLGPRDPRFEERFAEVTIAAVVEGSFLHRSAAGTALLHPGALLLGNAGACFECGHEHGTGDRCIGFRFAPALFEEIAASAAGSHRFRFPTAMLPASRALATLVVELEAEARGPSPIAAAELALRLAEAVLAILSGRGRTSAAPAPRDERRISAVLRHIEERSDEALDLDALAGVACMSKYHFLRSFRRIVGVTPYRYLLDLRMRRAALRLRTTKAPVSSIAFDAGFGDLSTFNGRFRAMFGASPSAFRRAG